VHDEHGELKEEMIKIWDQKTRLFECIRKFGFLASQSIQFIEKLNLQNFQFVFTIYGTWPFNNIGKNIDFVHLLRGRP
jgi:hypothetical protein